MIRSYKSLLPGYLDGKNITAHSSIIDEQNLKLYQKIMQISRVFQTQCPIIVERIQEGVHSCTIRVHIQLETNIKSIIITGDYNYSQVFPEEEVVTNDVIEFVVEDEEHTLVNPSLVITVQTYDGTEYTKGYPENDSIQEDIYDHDEFLDRLGACINLPRRLYKKYPLAQAKFTTPEFFGKKVHEGTVQETTEDDYYYCQRIQLFLRGDLSSILKASTSNSISLFKQSVVPVGDTITFLVNKHSYDNLEYDDWQGAIQQYLPCTRRVQLLITEPPTITVNNNSLLSYLNYLFVEGNVKWNNYNLKDYPVKLYDPHGRLLSTYTTDQEGNFNVTTGGFPPTIIGSSNFQLYGEPDVDKGIESVTKQFEGVFGEDLYLGAAAWTGNVSNESNSLIIPSGVTSTSPLLMQVYALPNTWELFYIFRFHSGDARLGFRQDTTNKYFLCNPTSCYVGSESVHNLRLKAFNGVVYMYLDGLYTGNSFTLSQLGTGLLNLLLQGNLTVSSIKFKNSTDVNPPTEQETETPVGTVTVDNIAYNQRILHIPLNMTFPNTKFQITINGGGVIEAVSDSNNNITLDISGSQVHPDLEGNLTLRNMINPAKTLIINNPLLNEVEKEFTFNQPSWINAGIGNVVYTNNNLQLSGGVRVLTDLFDTRYTQNTLFKIVTEGSCVVSMTYIDIEKENMDLLSSTELFKMISNHMSGNNTSSGVAYIEYRPNGYNKTITTNATREFTIGNDAKRGFLQIRQVDTIGPVVINEVTVTQYNTSITQELDGTTFTHVLSKQNNNMQIPLRNTDLNTTITTGTMKIRKQNQEGTLYEGPILNQIDFSTIMNCTVGTHNIQVIWEPPTTDKGIYKTEQANITLKVIEGLLLTGIQNTYPTYYGGTITITGTAYKIGDEENIPLSGYTVRIVDNTSNEIILTDLTGANGQITIDLNTTGGMYGRGYHVELVGDYETISSETFTIELLRHDVLMTVPNVTGYTNSSVDIPVSLVDENSDVVTMGEVSAELVLVESSPVKVMDGLLQEDTYLKFNSAELDTSTGMLYISCLLVDGEGDVLSSVEGTPRFTCSVDQNQLMFHGYDDVVMTVTNETDITLHCFPSTAEIYIEVPFEDIPGMDGLSVDTQNQTVTLTGTWNIRGETNTNNWSLTGQYTEVTEE